MRNRWIPLWWNSTTPLHGKEERTTMKTAFKVAKTLTGLGLLAFLGTFSIFMFNLENKMIYYVIRPLLNKHYDTQTRDRKI